ncbi:HAMP domain-containing sensor histidine kinase [Microbacterium sp. Kw_RZR3]|uniref:sensor histidine kinase n=1 Tax=unclassified Microbacterium TaxID=2609290 RepID=UPI0023DBFBBB|nr:HAMP domain-containing sensor histidine kinase [Microbacterium sp. Kw_RZR3]MDF2046071.1 HAMP domain-containing sensor histidine kinase [Microbacterium sp. Kw_RZR3]MDF2508529.1 arlS [Microbacterium sp.]
MSTQKYPLDADALLVRAAARRVALTITVAVSLLVVAVLVAAFSVVLTQIPLGDLLHPGPRETVVDIDGVDILLAGTLIGVAAIASAGLLGWLVTRRAVRPLVDALRRQREFVADASHELRTPLAVLDARIQVLQRSLTPSDPHASVVADLRADSRALIGVMADLLESVEIPKDAVSEPAPVAPVVESSIAAMRLLARQREVTLVSRLSSDDLRVSMPASSLQRCVVALVDNAVKHSPAAGKVVVSVRREGRHVRIDVTDEGPGIRGISPDRVFDRFARSAHAVGGGGSSRSGFGIGLALVQDAVTRYGGSAIVSTTSDAGTTMTLRIPVSR